jgi:hypothetical protein
MGDERKLYNKNCDKTRTDRKLREKRKKKLYATNLTKKQIHENQCLGLVWSLSRCETIIELMQEI